MSGPVYHINPIHLLIGTCGTRGKGGGDQGLETRAPNKGTTESPGVHKYGESFGQIGFLEPGLRERGLFETLCEQEHVHTTAMRCN